MKENFTTYTPVKGSFYQFLVTGLYFLIALVMTLVVSNLYFHAKSEALVSKDSEKLYSRQIILQDMRVIAREELLTLQNIVMENSAEHMANQIVQLSQLQQVFEELSRDLNNVLFDDEDRAEKQKLDQLVKAVQSNKYQFTRFVEAGDAVAAMGMYDVMYSGFETVIYAVEMFSDRVHNLQVQHLDDVKTQFTDQFASIVLIGVGMMIFAFVVSWLLLQVIVAKLNEINLFRYTLESENHKLRGEISMATQTSTAKSRLIADISQELSNPLLHLKSSLEGISQRAEEKVQNNLVIDKAEESLAQLIDISKELWDLSKIEAGRFEKKEEEVSLRKRLDELLIPFERKALRRGVKLAVYCGKDLPEKVVADFTNIGRVISQLINRSIDAVEEGMVELSIGFQENDRKLNISIKNLSASSEVESPRGDANLSETLEMEDNSLTKGVSIEVCKKIVDLLHGEIGFHNKKGEGSTFWLSLPVSLTR